MWSRGEAVVFAPVVDGLAAHAEALAGVEARKGAPGRAAGVARGGSRPQGTAERDVPE